VVVTVVNGPVRATVKPRGIRCCVVKLSFVERGTLRHGLLRYLRAVPLLLLQRLCDVWLQLQLQLATERGCCRLD
jgi:hypothetical protein